MPLISNPVFLTPAYSSFRIHYPADIVNCFELSHFSYPYYNITGHSFPVKRTITTDSDTFPKIHSTLSEFYSHFDISDSLFIFRSYSFETNFATIHSEEYNFVSVRPCFSTYERSSPADIHILPSLLTLLCQ